MTIVNAIKSTARSFVTVNSKSAKPYGGLIKSVAIAISYRNRDKDMLDRSR